MKERKTIIITLHESRNNVMFYNARLTIIYVYFNMGRIFWGVKDLSLGAWKLRKKKKTINAIPMRQLKITSFTFYRQKYLYWNLRTCGSFWSHSVKWRVVVIFYWTYCTRWRFSKNWNRSSENSDWTKTHLWVQLTAWVAEVLGVVVKVAAEILCSLWDPSRF